MRRNLLRLGHSGQGLVRQALLHSLPCWTSPQSIASNRLAPSQVRGFSTNAVLRASDLDAMNIDELKQLVRELRGSKSAPEVKGTNASTITGAPENYMPRPTKGEASDLKNITIVELQKLRQKKQPITMVTAYDFPSAVHVDLAGIDMVLVGDSVGMVTLGYDTTLPVTFEEILHHCRAVSRGARRPLLVGDLPFGSYEVSTQEAQRNAYRLLKEGGMEAVKLEGADAQRLRTVETLVKGGIAVMGHIGLTPQSYSTLGGFRAQGRNARQAVDLIKQAKLLEMAGAFATVIECVPDEVGKIVTEEVSIPTIGIGAGGYTSGQVLVYHDLLGMMQHPHHAKVSPKFCKQFSAVGVTIHEALQGFASEVRTGAFPGPQYSPYKMMKGEHEQFRRLLAEADVAREGGGNLQQPPAQPAEDDGEPMGKLY